MQLMPTGFLSVAIGVADATISYLGTSNDSSSSPSFTSFPFGTASADRYIVVGFWTRGAGITAVSIGGVSATQIKVQANTGESSIWIANVPTGTSGTVALTGGATQTFIGGWELHKLTGAGVATATASATTSGGAMSLTSVSAGGVAIGVTGCNAADGTYTWTAILKDYDTESTRSGSGAHNAYASVQTNLSVPVSYSGALFEFGASCAASFR